LTNRCLYAAEIFPQHSFPPARPDGVLRLTDSARRGELVAIVGTGVSIGLTDNKIPALSWKGLILHGFAHGVQKGTISAAQERAWKTQLDSSDLDDLLGAAEFMGRKLGAPHGDLYARWLENVFKAVQPTNQKLQNALRALNAAGIPICTLNYDPLLERVTGLPAINLSETAKVAAWMRKESPGVLHLHGFMGLACNLRARNPRLCDDSGQRRARPDPAQSRFISTVALYRLR